MKKLFYSQKIAPYVFVRLFVLSLIIFWAYQDQRYYHELSGHYIRRQNICGRPLHKAANDKFFATAVFNEVWNTPLHLRCCW